MEWRFGLRALLSLAVLCGCALSMVTSARNNAFIGYHETVRNGRVSNVQQRKSTDFKVKISSGYGEFIIKLRPDLAPDTCLLVWELAQKGNCPNCKFYRHEPVPMNWGQAGFYGPPYALLQGSLSDLQRQPPFENKAEMPVKKGHVAMIPNCKEFFIATADHPEWGHSHTIWGEVEDLSAEPSYPFEPFHSATNSDKITTRWLDNTYAFNLTALESRPQQTATTTTSTTTATTLMTAASVATMPVGTRASLSDPVLPKEGILLDRIITDDVDST